MAFYKYRKDTSYRNRRLWSHLVEINRVSDLYPMILDSNSNLDLKISNSDCSISFLFCHRSSAHRISSKCNYDHGFPPLNISNGYRILDAKIMN